MRQLYFRLIGICKPVSAVDLGPCDGIDQVIYLLHGSPVLLRFVFVQFQRWKGRPTLTAVHTFPLSRSDYYLIRCFFLDRWLKTSKLVQRVDLDGIEDILEVSIPPIKQLFLIYGWHLFDLQACLGLFGVKDNVIFVKIIFRRWLTGPLRRYWFRLMFFYLHFAWRHSWQIRASIELGSWKQLQVSPISCLLLVLFLFSVRFGVFCLLVAEFDPFVGWIVLMLFRLCKVH